MTHPCNTADKMGAEKQVEVDILNNVTLNFFKCFTRWDCLVLITALFINVAIAQDRGSVGLGSPGATDPELTAAQRANFDKQVKTSLASNEPIRVVNGKVYNVIQSDSWKPVEGIVEFQLNDVTILKKTVEFGRTGTYMAITNSAQFTANQHIVVAAIRNGTFNFSGKPIELWDCGTSYQPPPPAPEQIRIAQENAKKRTALNRQKSWNAQSNAIVWLAPQATNGVLSAQYSLALHYLNGQGCETNRTVALYWLNKAAAQGSDEAIRKLSELKRLEPDR